MATSFSTSHITKLPQAPPTAVYTHRQSRSLPAQALQEISHSEQKTKENIMYRTSMTFKKLSTKPTLIHTSPPSNSPNQATPKHRRVPDSPKPKYTLRETLDDAALSWLFNQYLQQNHCEENLLFYKDLTKFFVEFDKLKSLLKVQRKATMNEVQDKVKQQALQTQIQVYFQACNNSIYVMYNRFLAPSAPCELNIDSKSRALLVNTITSRIQPLVDAVEQQPETSSSVINMDNLSRVSIQFERVKMHVYRTMENDSLPKFFMSDLYLSGMKSISTMKNKKKKENEKKELLKQQIEEEEFL